MAKQVVNDYGVKVGDPVSFSCWTDIYPGVVVSVTKKTITIREVEHGKNKVQWPDQDWDIYLDKPIGAEKTFRFNASTMSWKGQGFTLGVGHARYYCDPSF